MKSKTLILALTISATVAIFSDSTAQPAPAAQAADPCAALTPAQVSTILGFTVGAGTHPSPKYCDWGVAGKRLTLGFQGPEFFPNKAPTPGITKAQVSGLGDDAVASTLGNMATLFVKKGSVVVVVRIYGVPADEAIPKEKAVAAEALKKI